MSKSRGNIVRATPIVDVMGIDALRYYLLRETSFGKDGSFSYDALVGRYNSDLANGLGNLVSRTLTMINQYRDGYIPPKTEVSLTDTIRRVQEFYDEFDFSRALEEIWSAISWLDGFIVQQQPWKLAKSQAEGAQDQLDAVLYTAAEYIRVITALVCSCPARDGGQDLAHARDADSRCRCAIHRFGRAVARPGQKVEPVSALFPRIESAQAIEKMKQLESRRDSATICPVREGDPERGADRIDDQRRVASAGGLTIGCPSARTRDHHRRLRQGRPARRTGKVR